MIDKDKTIHEKTMLAVAKGKLEKMKAGAVVVTNVNQLDDMLTLGDKAIYEVRSLPNPNRVGILDQFIAWIGDSMVPPSMSPTSEGEETESAE